MTTKRTLTSVILGIAMMTSASQAWAAVPWAPDVATAQQAAAQRNQLVLVHFWTPTCGPCLTLERNVFSQPFVGDSIAEGFVPVKVDASRDPALAQRLGVRSWPTDVILTPQGQVVRTLGCPQDPGQYVAQLRTVMEQAAMARGGTGAPAPGSFSTSAANPPHQSARSPGGYEAERNPRFGPPSGSSYGAQDYQGQTGPLRQQHPARQAMPGRPVASDYRGGAPATQPRDPRETYPIHGGPQPGGQGYGGGAVGPAVPPTDRGYGGDYAERDLGRAGPSGVGDPRGAGFGVPSPNEANRSVRERYTGGSQFDERADRRDIAGAPPAGVSGTGLAPANSTDGRPPLGLEGHCPVTLITKNSWKKGDPRHGAIHRGRTYLFTGPDEQKLFLERPDAFSPVLSGNDAVLFVDRGELAPGTRRHGLEYNRQIYLFSSEASLEKFSRSPRSYAISVYQAMQQESPGRTSLNRAPGQYPR